MTARERLFEQGLCLVIRAKAAIHPAQQRQHAGLQLRLAGQLFLHLRAAGVEDAADRRVDL